MPAFRQNTLRCCLFSIWITLAGQACASDPGGLAPVYQTPTVTAEMGDAGGKYFGKAPDAAHTKHYYIAAEPELWNFAPQGQDPVCGKLFPTQFLLHRAAWKIRYVQYADPQFTQRVLPAERLGILGPALRGVTGDYLAVTFLNRAWRPLSMHPHGVKYDKDSEGSYYKPAPGLGAAVAPGARFTYVWHLDESSAPLPSEPSSKAWLYHSHVEGDDEINLGLIGSIIVTDPARARPDGTPADVDREMAALFLIFNEGSASTGAGDADDLPAQPSGAGPVAPPVQTWAQAAEAAETGQRHTINGLSFGNLNGLDMNEGERVRWYLFGLGSESDFHTAHWHGERVVENGNRRTDVVELLPASMKVADMVADNPGQWLFHCHLAEHMANGMFARFTVHPQGDSAEASRDPEIAFLGMPQSLKTLRWEDARVAFARNEIDLTGQVTVPSPFTVRANVFEARIGDKRVEFKPDASGLCVTQDGDLLAKNISQIGVVTGGTLRFELTLKGASWLDELNREKLLANGALAADAALPVEFTVAGVRHTASCALKMAVPAADAGD